MVRQRAFDLGLSDWLGGPIGTEAVGPDNAGGRGGVCQIAGAHGNILSLYRSASGIAAYDKMMTVAAKVIPRLPVKRR